jgi:hypothetical protein
MKRAFTAVVVAAATLSLEAVARAEPSDLATTEEMRRELRALREEADALQAALAEAAQYDRVRTDALRRALAAVVDASEPTAAPSGPPRTTVAIDEGTRARPARERKPARRRKAGSSGKVLGGKVTDLGTIGHTTRR